MPKLTDAQLVILCAAAQRDGGAALPLPKSLKIKGAAATKVLDGLLKKHLLEERPAPREAVAWREGKDGGRLMLVITEAGLKAIDSAPTGETPKQSELAKSPAKKPRAERTAANPKPKDQNSAPAARAGTKQTLLITLLQRRSGATIDEIAEATGWQAHSVRGAISGAPKKKLGLAVTSEKVAGRGRIYRIAQGG